MECVEYRTITSCSPRGIGPANNAMLKDSARPIDAWLCCKMKVVALGMENEQPDSFQFRDFEHVASLQEHGRCYSPYIAPNDR
jgi:hypothetical protein